MTTYRTMTKADIADLIPMYIEYYNADGDCWTPETVRRRIWQVLGAPDSFCLLAEENGEVIGFAMGRMEQFWDLTAYNLEEILVAPAHQRKGHGTALMVELENRVKALGTSMVQLKAVADEQHERFYGRLGYYNSENLRLKGKFL